MEIERDDGTIARVRCIEALAGSSDPKTRLALWKAAKRYAEKSRVSRNGLEFVPAHPDALAGETTRVGG